MEEKFIQLFAETLDFDCEHNLTSDTVFRNLEQWDSLAFLSVIAMIDEEWDVVIEGNDFQKLKTIGDVIAEIERRKE